jgi:hypothetical protein
MKTNGKEYKNQKQAKQDFIFTKGPKTYIAEMTSFSTNGTGKTGYLHVEN